MARTGKRKAPVAAAPEDAAAIELVEPEYQPTGSDGDMFGGTPAKKAQHFWPSVKRLVGLLRPERAQFSLVVALVAASVVLTVIAPKILGAAMDVIFNGVLGAGLPAGVPLEQLVAAARAAGHGQYADMLAKTGIIPGQGIDFVQLSRLIAIVLSLYMVASTLMWLQGFLLNALVMRVVFRLREDIEG
jgi:ATP-binding cassette, subfamily B, multidrug efflux pump